MNIGFLNQIRNFNQFFYNSLDIFVDIDNVRFNLLDDFYFRRSRDKFIVIVEFINFRFFLVKCYKLLNKFRNFFNFFNLMNNLNYFLLDNLNWISFSIDNYFIPNDFLYFSLDIRNVMMYIYFLNFDNFFSLRNNLLYHLRNGNYMGHFVSNVYWKLFLKSNRHRHLNWMNYNSVIINNFHVLNMKIFDPVFEHLDRNFLLLNYDSLISYFFRFHNCLCL